MWSLAPTCFFNLFSYLIIHSHFTSYGFSMPSLDYFNTPLTGMYPCLNYFSIQTILSVTNCIFIIKCLSDKVIPPSKILGSFPITLGIKSQYLMIVYTFYSELNDVP